MSIYWCSVKNLTIVFRVQVYYFCQICINFWVITTPNYCDLYNNCVCSVWCPVPKTNEIWIHCRDKHGVAMLNRSRGIARLALVQLSRVSQIYACVLVPAPVLCLYIFQAALILKRPLVQITCRPFKKICNVSNGLYCTNKSAVLLFSNSLEWIFRV